MCLELDANHRVYNSLRVSDGRATHSGMIKIELCVCVLMMEGACPCYTIKTSQMRDEDPGASIAAGGKPCVQLIQEKLESYPSSENEKVSDQSAHQSSSPTRSFKSRSVCALVRRSFADRIQMHRIF